ncbi:MAG TPA: redox-regulated ATPase YchF [Patescibacteria group bacterium]|nr:redox-regulated ATPase YchF [Patescibacteria group bacterium]
MSFKVAIVGLPNVGKSTIFKALTKKQVDIANYPFCTIEPNVGTVAVPDFRLEKLNDFYNSPKIVPTIIEFFDIAGLVKGAHEGQGLGNKFLSHIRETDAICQVLRAFEDENIIHVDGKINPASDLETINLELIFADMETVQKRIENLSRQLKSSKDKNIVKTNDLLLKIKENLEKGAAIRDLNLDIDEKKLIQDCNFLTIKPILYILNVLEGDIAEKKEKILEKFNLKLNPEKVVLISAKIESELAELGKDEAINYLKELGVEESGLDQLIKASYAELNLITFFTAGPKEAHAWTLEKGLLAPQAAGKIHTDFEKGFIRAEVINWKDLIDAGGDAGAKEKGLIRIEGKEYVVRDGDVVEIRFQI